MKKRLISITLFFIAFITVILLIAGSRMFYTSRNDLYRQQLVDLNEIVKLSGQNSEESNRKLKQALEEFKEKQVIIQNSSNMGQSMLIIGLLYGVCILFLVIIFAYVYIVILKPFDKLQKYADEIAKGNFDVDLKYERTNYFGKFTWAFDHMRREITKARACEKEAIENNKTVIATLSHDIKTPIASIRAYAEGLDAGLDSGPVIRRKYSEVIMKKCDEVTKLTNDLFLHSLADLNKLKINRIKVNLREFFRKTRTDLQMDDFLIHINGEIPNVSVMMDEKRFEQVMENLINNAKKYALERRMDMKAELIEDKVLIALQDYGGGIPDEDMPFIFDKFYRGRNVGSEQGSGLGLYIVKYIMEQMEGRVELYNTCDGLKVILELTYTS